MPRNYRDAPPTAYQRLPPYQRGDDWIRAFLRGAKVGHIASARDGQPYLNPSTFWFDEEHHQIIFHSNVAGRVRSNIENNPKVCFEASEIRSVIVFGTARLVSDPGEARRVLYGLIKKYFPTMTPGKEFREITDKELRATSVYAIQIEEWSGKENWQERADQSDEWTPLDEKWLE